MMSNKTKTLIVFPGDVSQTFFVNEIPYFLEKFNKVYVCAFHFHKKEIDVIEKYNLKIIDLSKYSFKFSTLKKLINWRKRDYVKSEISKFVNFSLKGLKRFAYITLYGIYNALSEEIVKDYFKDDEEIYLYAYRLSRPAFCVANLNHFYGNDIKISCSRAHRFDLYEEKNAIEYLPFREFIFKNFNKVYFISEHGKHYCETKYTNFIKQNQLEVSKLGTSNPNKIKKEFKEKNQIVIASCSNIIQVKRLDIIINCIETLQKKNLNVKWIHLGDGNLKNKMIELANSKLLSNSYSFLGFVENKDILSLYKEYDVDYFINMSDSEGVPVSIMEALSMGIPAIARDVGGNKEIINSYTGLLIEEIVEPSDAENKMYEFISKRINSFESYKQLSNQAISYWENNYSADSNYNCFFEHLLNYEESI